MIKFLLQGGVVLAIALTLFYYLLQVQVISIPLIIALILANLLEPFCVSLEAKGHSRSKAVIIVFLSAMVVFGIVLAIGGNVLSSLVAEFGDQFPVAAERIGGVQNQLQLALSSALPFEFQLNFSEIAASTFESFQSDVLPQVPGMVVNLLLGGLTVPIATFFLMRDGRAMKKALMTYVPNRYFEMVSTMQYRVSNSVSAYIRGVATEAGLVGTVDLVLLYSASLITGIDIQYIPVICAFAAMTNVIPFAGPFIGTLLGIGISLFGADPAAIYVVAICLVIGQLLDNIVFAPLVLGGAVSVHPITVIVLLVLGGKLMGVTGMVVIVPLYAVISVIAQELYIAIRRHSLFLT